MLRAVNLSIAVAHDGRVVSDISIACDQFDLHQLLFWTRALHFIIIIIIVDVFRVA